MDAHGRSNGGRAMIITMVGRWVRVKLHAATCRLDAFTLGTPKWSDFVLLASLLTLQALSAFREMGFNLGFTQLCPYQ